MENLPSDLNDADILHFFICESTVEDRFEDWSHTFLVLGRFDNKGEVIFFQQLHFKEDRDSKYLAQVRAGINSHASFMYDRKFSVRPYLSGPAFDMLARWNSLLQSAFLSIHMDDNKFKTRGQDHLRWTNCRTALMALLEANGYVASDAFFHDKRGTLSEEFSAQKSELYSPESRVNWQEEKERNQRWFDILTSGDKETSTRNSRVFSVVPQAEISQLSKI